MNRQPRSWSVAVFFAMLMVGPVLLPGTAAEHTDGVSGELAERSQDNVPSTWTLPQIEPTDECVAIGSSSEMMHAMQAIEAQDASYLAQDKGIPMLCGADGRPIGGMREVVLQANGILENFRNVTRETQRQADARWETTFFGASPPNVVLLDDRFDGHRLGGFGKWETVTSDGRDSAFGLKGDDTPEGWRMQWRFGDDAGYARGTREFLVSPQIDLGGLRGNYLTKNELARQEIATENALFTIRGICFQLLNPTFCQQLEATGLYDYYDALIEEENLTLVDPIATLTFNYGHNFAYTSDGLRAWVWLGEQPPTRADLFSASFGNHAPEKRCLNDPVAGSTLRDEVPSQCVLHGAQRIDLDHTAPTNAFRVHQPGAADFTAATGFAETKTVTVDLSEAFGARQSVWVLFEVATDFSTGRGGNHFDAINFPHQEKFGFTLSDIHVEGPAFPRNVRISGMGEPWPTLLPGEDEPLRIAVPPGNQPVVFHVQNAGAYRENATLDVVVRKSEITVDRRSFPILDMRPGETREVNYLWPVALKDGEAYAFDATLRLPNATNVTFSNVTSQPANNLEPDRSQVRWHNHGVVAVQNVRVDARLDHELRIAPLQVCQGRPGERTVCEEEFAARKGDPRHILTSVHNRGSLAQDVEVVLHLQLDGVDMTPAILDGASRTLLDLQPNERREITWALSLVEPGIYRATVIASPDGSQHQAVALRELYVQRTTGVLCIDNFVDVRRCAPAWSTTLDPHFQDQDLTAAAFDAQGRLFVATSVSETAGGLYVRAADGWMRLAALDNKTLAARFPGEAPINGTGSIHAMTFASDGRLYGVGGNGTAFVYTTGGDIQLLRVNDTLHRETALRDLAWFGGNLWAVGGSGKAFVLQPDQDGTLLFEPREMTWKGKNADGEPQMYPLPGERNALRLDTAAAHNGRLYVAGENGVVFRTNATGWERVVNLDLGTRDIRSLGVVNRTLYAAGENGLVLVLSGTAFRQVPGLPPQVGAVDFEHILWTHLSTTYFASGTEFATCDTCLSTTNGGWSLPVVTLPVLLDDDLKSQTLRVLGSALDKDRTLLVGQNGLFVELFDGASRGHSGDWTTLPSLVGHDGGFLETLNVESLVAAFRGVPAMGTQFNTRGDYRITLNHHVTSTPAQPTPNAHARLIFSNHPEAAFGRALDQDLHPCPQATTPSGTLCNLQGQGFVYGIRSFEKPTEVSGWSREQFTFSLPERAGSFEFVAFELLRQGRTWWAVDDVVVEHRADANAPWRSVMSYYGPQSPACTAEVTDRCNLGSWREARQEGSDVPAIWQQKKTDQPVLRQNLVSLWHVTQSLTDRPVWVANDEITHDGNVEPHLRNHFDNRLVSPIIDLSPTFDPVVSFRHLFSFRTQVGGSVLTVGDGGFVEVQYKRHGLECPGNDPKAECWSRFFRVTPEGGYPNATALGVGGLTTYNSAQLADGTTYGPTQFNGNAANAFWARNVQPDARGFISATDVDLYEEVRINLADQTIVDRDGMKVDLAGRQIRVAFHLATSVDTTDNFHHTAFHNVYNPRSYAGEGWYITDFKVNGARKLGIDLRAADLTIPVGFDVDRIGVGPNTRVPVNVTIENRGRFDALGYTGTLEVRRITDALLQRSELVRTIQLSQQPLVEPGAKVNHTLFWDVPAMEGATYMLAFTVTPIGIDEDEDPTDNTVRLGTLAKPVLAQTHRDLRVDFLVTPEEATMDVTRFVPIYLDNRGNVPLSDITVKRDVHLLGGPLAGKLESISWRTDVPVQAGMRVPLATISNDIDPVRDLFWRAPERASFYFVVDAEIASLDLRSTADKRISAFATYLFDDAETGPTGESILGNPDWTLDDGWSVAGPGFRSPRAYSFGDVALERYPADADASARAPTIDLGPARSAVLAFYHRYSFEEQFDGGIVEASADGGRTWTPLTPMTDLLNGLARGYPNTGIVPTSPLHGTGHPADERLAFTGDSSTLPQAVDGWVLTQFDLTQFEDITRRAAYDAFPTSTAFDLARPLDINGRTVWTDPSWVVGPLEEYRYWEVQNLTQQRVTSVAGNSSFWWSGSASFGDDGVSPARNNFLIIPVDLTAHTSENEIVTIEWWEWADRYLMASTFYDSSLASTPHFENLRGAHAFTSGSAGHTWRFGITQPDMLEKNGKWIRFSATFNDSFKGTAFDVMFGYTPHTTDSTVDDPPYPGTRGSVGNAYRNDPGFAIDGFQVVKRVVSGGQTSAPIVILDTATAWATAEVKACPSPNQQNTISCVKSGNVRPMVPSVDGNKNAAPGKVWSLVEEIPSIWSSWSVVDIHDDHRGLAKRPDGEQVTAWYTGDIALSTDTCTACVRPLSESRLVTPAVDLGKVAGADAQLAFWHRHAFHSGTSLGSDPLASGGVVEMQILDEQTGAWSDWTQIYARPVEDSFNAGGLTAAGGFGGYSGFTVNATRASTGKMLRLDAPFDALDHDDKRREGIQFLYAGKSTSATNNWRAASFDVSEHIGKTVRFGFHTAFTGAPASTQGGQCLDVKVLPAGFNVPVIHCKSGWWISDVEVRGTVLAGEPVQLRLRAGTDGNVQDGIWQVDDFSVFGSRYRENLAVFYEEGPHGVVGNETTSIPVVIRNLGSTVRVGIALEALLADGKDGLVFEASAPGTAGYDDQAPNVYRLTGFNLAPGASARVLLNVTPKTEIATKGTLDVILRLREHNPAASVPYVPIVQNEVHGFLEQSVRVQLETASSLLLGPVGTLPARPDAHEPVHMRIPVTNDGFTSFDLDLSCTASSFNQFRSVDHSTGAKPSPIVIATYPCELVAGETTLAPGESTLLVYESVPTHDGHLRFTVEGTRTDVRTEWTFGPIDGTAAVGIERVLRHDEFTDSGLTLGQWNPSTGAFSPPTWSERGNREAGALLLGEPDRTGAQDYRNVCVAGSSTAGGICHAQSPVLDLRAYSEMDKVYLSFWHLKRFASGDGADVKVQILMNEHMLRDDRMWRPELNALEDVGIASCRVTPQGGYGGTIRSFWPHPDADGNERPSSRSPAFMGERNGETVNSQLSYFTSNGWEEDWRLVKFDLSETKCEIDGAPVSLQGKMIRLHFMLYVGESEADQLQRGTGHGWFIDDLSVSPNALTVEPKSPQQAILLDDTTKRFHVVLHNPATFPDLVRIVFDEDNSSAPVGSIHPPVDPVELAPGETRMVEVLVTLPRDPSLLAANYVARLRAQSLFDINAVGVTDLRLSFAPRQWPDLSLTIDKPANVVQEGTETLIPILIENHGLVTSLRTTLRIVDTFPGREPVTVDLDVPPMSSFFENADDSSRIIEFRWRPEMGSVGTHRLHFEVDPLHVNEEYTRLDNVRTLDVPVSRLLIPDLSIAEADALVLRNALGAALTPTRNADVSRYEVSSGELVTFQVKVRNHGAAGATNVDVRAFIGPLSLPAKTVPFVPAGGEVMVPFNWVAQKGEYPLKVVVRSEQIEVTLANNEHPVVGVTRLTVKDYEVEILSTVLDGIKEPGTVVPLAVVLHNSGQAGEEIELVAQLPDGWRVVFERPQLFLRPQERYESTAFIEVPFDAVAGEQFISVLAISRENPMKVATSRTSVDVRATYEGDVLVAPIRVSPGAFVLPVTLVNEGNSRDAWTVQAKLPPGWTSSMTLPAKVVVPPYGERVFELPLEMPSGTAPSLRELSILVALPDGQQMEETARLEVRPLRKASLTMADAAPSPSTGALAYPVVVENHGNVRQPFRMLMLDLPEGLEATVEPADFELSPGERARATLRVTPVAGVPAADHQLLAYALFAGVHPDTPEGRGNYGTLPLHIVVPDLRVLGIEHTPRGGIRSGETVVVKVPVENRGSAAATDVAVHLYANDLFITETTITRLEASASIEVLLHWTATPGQTTLTVVIDPFGDSVDLARDDNAVSTLVDVDASSAIGGVAAGRLTPAPGLFGFLAALGVAMLCVTISRRSGRPPK